MNTALLFSIFITLAIFAVVFFIVYICCCSKGRGVGAGCGETSTHYHGTVYGGSNVGVREVNDVSWDGGFGGGNLGGGGGDGGGIGGF